MKTPPPGTLEGPIYVESEKIRELFNNSSLNEQIRKGTYLKKFLRNDHLRNPQIINQPFCTRAQMIRYMDHEGKPVVEVFQYLRPDGTIGASGLPDPKRLWINKKLYVAKSLK